MKTIFEKFDCGQLLLPDSEKDFSAVEWNKHPTFKGVELKHLITSADTNGKFSCHLVRIAPNMEIGSHVHTCQIELHEVIDGSGICINDGASLSYLPGTVSVMQMNTAHEVIAGKDGLYLFAKFIPALC